MISGNKLHKHLFICMRNYSKATSSKWKSVVGLEVHAQINASSKLFSGASTKFSAPVNTNVSFLDCAIPGTLPVLNKKCVEAGVLTALALGCRVNPVSYFDRKHYFYADLPAGYQITQQRAPLAVDGQLEFQVFAPSIHKSSYSTKVKIKQIQLEQDSGKSLHDDDRSLVDLNRAGIPLMEVVFDPDLKDGEEAAALVKELVSILLRINTCSCKMEEGALRVDANVSIHREGEPLGVRSEIKNIGSVRGVAGAIEYEIKRQIKLRESGGNVINETRAWDALQKCTIPMRDKEVKQDYRYMPESNLPHLFIAMGPVDIGCVNADELRETIPELPAETRQRLRNDGLTMEQSVILVNDPPLLNIFETAVKGQKVNKKVVANLLINDLSTLLNKNNIGASEFKCPAHFFADIANLLQEEKINRNTSKVLVQEIFSGNTTTPNEILMRRNMYQITDDTELEILCQEIINQNEKMVKDYKTKSVKVLKAFLGLVAKKSENRANMAKCTIILKKLLSK